MFISKYYIVKTTSNSFRFEYPLSRFISMSPLLNISIPTKYKKSKNQYSFSQYIMMIQFVQLFHKIVPSFDIFFVLFIPFEAEFCFWQSYEKRHNISLTMGDTCSRQPKYYTSHETRIRSYESKCTR